MLLATCAVLLFSIVSYYSDSAYCFEKDKHCHDLPCYQSGMVDVQIYKEVTNECSSFLQANEDRVHPRYLLLEIFRASVSIALLLSVALLLILFINRKKASFKLDLLIFFISIIFFAVNFFAVNFFIKRLFFTNQLYLYDYFSQRNSIIFVIFVMLILEVFLPIYLLRRIKN